MANGGKKKVTQIVDDGLESIGANEWWHKFLVWTIVMLISFGLCFAILKAVPALFWTGVFLTFACVGGNYALRLSGCNGYFCCKQSAKRSGRNGGWKCEWLGFKNCLDPRE